MEEDNLENIPKQIAIRVRDDPDSFVGREKHLLEDYGTGDNIDHESPKAIQKELDGMARLLCALSIEDQISNDIEQYLDTFDNVKEQLLDLEREIVEDL